MLRIIAFLLLAATPAAATILFQDSFDAAPDDAWVIPNGGWQWSDGRFLNTSSCGFQGCMSPLFVGRADWDDATLALDFTPTAGGVVYLLFGMSAPSLFEVGGTTGWCLDLGWRGEAKILHGGSSPGGELLAADMTGTWQLAAGTTYTIEFGKVGNQIQASCRPAGSSTPAWRLAATDARPSHGWCGFATWNTTGCLDNVAVTGAGVVPVESTSWGGIKSLFR